MRSQNRADLGRSSLKLATALHDCLDNGLVIISAGGKITAFNPGAERLLGRKATLTLGRPLSLLPAALRKAVRDSLASGQLSPEVQFKTQPAGGGPTTLRAMVYPLKSGRKNSGTAIVLNDVSPLTSLELNMRRLDRLASVGTLSASMAHEIKNALVAVKTFIDLLLEKNSDAELAQTVGREMRRIDAIVSQMLRFAGPAQAVRASIRVHDVLEHALRMVQHQMEGRLISLKRQFNAAADTVRGDDYQLEQAFVNLLLNALEAMGPNGALTVSTDTASAAAPGGLPNGVAAAGLVRVRVQDTGVGISPQNMTRLFEPFFTTKRNGTGLGLAICQRIIQEHHGDISVQSEQNRGTTFTVSLPASVSAP